MVLKCWYCGEAADKKTGRTFHQFPLNQPELLQSWLKNMDLGSNFIPTKSMKLCSDHFSKECFQKAGVNVKLVDGSVPTLFGRYKAACVYCAIKRTHEDHRSFHKFPLRSPVLLEKWLKGMGKENYFPSEESLLCSDHFEQTCFRPSGKGNCLRLRSSAIPTLFAPIIPEGMPVVTVKRKHDALQESSVAKYSRLNTQCETAVQPIASCNLSSFSNDVQVVEQHMMHSSPCTAMTHPDVDCESRLTLNPSEKATDLPNATVSSEISPPGVTTTPRRRRQPATPRTAQRISFMTKHDHQYENSPKTIKTKLMLSNKKIKLMQEELRTHKQRIKRLHKKIKTLTDIVSELRRSRALPESGLSCLDSIAEDDVSQFLKRFIKNQRNVKDTEPPVKKRQWKHQRRNPGLGISKEKYPPALRSFAMTLHFYSPKAYGFVRRKFCNALPDPATLRSWYSTINGEPGYTSESFNALKIKVSEAKNAGREVLVAFMLDEMGIKKGMQNTSNGTVRGYVDLGTDMKTSGLVPLAKDALVMMVVSIDGRWKIPIGYFFITGIDSATNSGLITDGLVRLHEIGVKVVSVTLDGPSQHFATMRSLGATFDMPNPKPFFSHPATGDKVFVIFDACHMVKLIRNCLGDVKILKNGEGNLIEWRFVEALASLQAQEGLRAGNRLRTAHVRYHTMKMKVALAAQTLSSSVADSISFCDNYLGLSQFKASEATVRFIQCVDRLFDFLNSRNPLANGYKAPLRPSNETFWRPRITEELDYLKQITDITGKPMWRTPRYVPFVGFITGVMSVMEIFDLYVKPEDSQTKYLLTYKLSQDHIELFFCAIRSCGGWCPNPTCMQFVSAYKRLLVHHEVTATNGNSEAMDNTRVLTVSSGASNRKSVDRYDVNVYDRMNNIRVTKKYGLDDEVEYNSEPDEFLNEFLHFHNKLPDSLSNFSKACVANIGGWVVKKLVDERRPIVKCEKCRDSLFQKSQLIAEFSDNALIQAKTRGGLIFPSESVVAICQHSEQLLRLSLNKNRCMTPRESNFPALVCTKVIEDLLQTPGKLFPSLNDHVFDDSLEELSNHVYLLTKQVCKTYIQLRLFAATNLASEAAVGTKLRHHMTRKIVWKSQ